MFNQLNDNDNDRMHYTVRQTMWWASPYTKEVMFHCLLCSDRTGFTLKRS